MSKFYNFARILTLVTLTACLGEVPPSTDSREYDANARLMETFAPLEGTYVGVLTDNPNGESDLPIQLELFMAFEPAGRNEDGEVKMVPVLQAQYKRLDLEDARQNYFIPFVRFYKESGQIVFSTQEDMQSRTPGVGYLSIFGTLLGDTVNARLKDHRGLQGRLILEKILL